MQRMQRSCLGFHGRHLASSILFRFLQLLHLFDFLCPLHVLVQLTVKRGHHCRHQLLDRTKQIAWTNIKHSWPKWTAHFASKLRYTMR
jgi:hypothetical protein